MYDAQSPLRSFLPFCSTRYQSRGDYPVSELDSGMRKSLGILLTDDKLVDLWGNPRRVIAEDRENGVFIGIYSAGMDGESSTNGNDPDDINSWGQIGKNHYPEAKRERAARQARVAGLWGLFAAVLFLLVFEWRMLRRPKRRKSKRTSRRSQHLTLGVSQPS